MGLYSLSEIFGSFSSLLGLLVAVLVCRYMKGKPIIQTSLLFLLIVLVLITFLGMLNYSGKIRMLPNLIRVDSPIHYLLGPATYFYTLTSLKDNFKFKNVYLLHLVPFFINVIQFIPFYLSDQEFKLMYYNELMTNGTVIMKRQYLIKTLLLWMYLIAQVLLFIKYALKSKSIYTDNKYIFSWFIIFFGIQFIFYSGISFDHFTDLKTFSDPYKFAMNATSLMLILISITLLFFPKILYGSVFSDNLHHEKYSTSSLSEDNKAKILAAWLQFVNDNDKPYLNSKITITDVAKELKITSQNLSQVINEKTGLNFNEYINSLRIEEAKKILTSDSYNKLTINAIALKSGFNSKSPFYAAFKKHTGLTPKEFINTK